MSCPSGCRSQPRTGEMHHSCRFERAQWQRFTQIFEDVCSSWRRLGPLGLSFVVPSAFACASGPEHQSTRCTALFEVRETFSGVKVDGANSRLVPSSMPLDARVIAPSAQPQMAGVRYFLPKAALNMRQKNKNKRVEGSPRTPFAIYLTHLFKEWEHSEISFQVAWAAAPVLLWSFAGGRPLQNCVRSTFQRGRWRSRPI